MSRAVLSLGSNLGDRRVILATAVASARPWARACSPVYETRPWPADHRGVEQGYYLNLILIVEDATASARDWLDRARALEEAAGRVRTVRFGPRTLDVDVISVDDLRSGDPQLTLPHPRAGERAFVLVPWLAVDPAGVLPGVGRIADLLARLDPGELAGVRLAAHQNGAGPTAGTCAQAGSSGQCGCGG